MQFVLPLIVLQSILQVIPTTNRHNFHGIWGEINESKHRNTLEKMYCNEQRQLTVELQFLIGACRIEKNKSLLNKKSFF